VARLPDPGSDNNIWGTVLNDYLQQSHKNDGTLKDSIVASTHLQDDAVTAAKLATSNNPGDGQVLGYTGGAMGWTTPAAGGSGPQIFVQSTDPGASAQDGDIWIDTSA
jgi:hypothetical protein